METADRRFDKRVAVDLLCTLVLPSGVKHSVMARNLSGGGAYVEVETPLSRGEQVELSFNLPTQGRLRRVHTRSEIIHGPSRISMTAFGIGVRFVELDEEGAELVDAFIDTQPAL
ncbi:PilZ domain-containing protein [Alkalilimnicola sp. S0819]|uniref:PilZ domain-containing protein n=1 Tax=Alkalilimnicola sp. S0819 TaxID=2613922 RepID=UPI00186A1031|nr:PilZ domain-containing protein [Alkalilimnicola sp. S0819]